jgi:hypothetical protein
MNRSEYSADNRTPRDRHRPVASRLACIDAVSVDEQAVVIQATRTSSHQIWELWVPETGA